jgi:hypothetical protein
MFNHASDVVNLLNMLRLNDKRPPVSLRPSRSRGRAYPTRSTQQKLATATVRGYVSYMPATRSASRGAVGTGDPLATSSPADTSMLGAILTDDRMRAAPLMMRWMSRTKFVPGD